MDITLFIAALNLIVITLAVIALILGFLYFLFSQRERIESLETRLSRFEENLARMLRELPTGFKGSGNPHGSGLSQEHEGNRRNELLQKLEAGVITRIEVMELNEILLKEKEEAKKRGDIAVLIATGLGLALLASYQARRR